MQTAGQMMGKRLAETAVELEECRGDVPIYTIPLLVICIETMHVVAKLLLNDDIKEVYDQQATGQELPIEDWEHA